MKKGVLKFVAMLLSVVILCSTANLWRVPDQNSGIATCGTDKPLPNPFPVDDPVDFFY